MTDAISEAIEHLSIAVHSATADATNANLVAGAGIAEALREVAGAISEVGDALRTIGVEVGSIPPR